MDEETITDIWQEEGAIALQPTYDTVYWPRSVEIWIWLRAVEVNLNNTSNGGAVACELVAAVIVGEIWPRPRLHYREVKSKKQQQQQHANGDHTSHKSNIEMAETIVGPLPIHHRDVRGRLSDPSNITIFPASFHFPYPHFRCINIHLRVRKLMTLFPTAS